MPAPQRQRQKCLQVRVLRSGGTQGVCVKQSRGKERLQDAGLWVSLSTLEDSQSTYLFAEDDQGPGCLNPLLKGSVWGLSVPLDGETFHTPCPVHPCDLQLQGWARERVVALLTQLCPPRVW